jgi:hypothetical protein
LKTTLCWFSIIEDFTPLFTLKGPGQAAAKITVSDRQAMELNPHSLY